MSDERAGMAPEQIESLFTGADSRYRFARWGRALAPVAFGVDDATLAVLRGAVDAVCQLTSQERAEADPELGANLMFFFSQNWAELAAVPHLDRMIPGLPDLVARLERRDANQYRTFRFDGTGAIKACFVFLRMDAALSQMPAGTLALGQVAQSVLLWSDTAFATRSPLAALPDKRVVLRPEIAAIIRAAYDPVLPPAADDASHALRLYARLAAPERQR